MKSYDPLLNIIITNNVNYSMPVQQKIKFSKFIVNDTNALIEKIKRWFEVGDSLVLLFF